MELKDIKVKSNAVLFAMQYGAMFEKKFHYFKRDKKSLCCEIVFPLLMMFIPLYFNKYADRPPPPTLLLDGSIYPSG
jgi:hypothetical protein